MQSRSMERPGYDNEACQPVFGQEMELDLALSWEIEILKGTNFFLLWFLTMDKGTLGSRCPLSEEKSH